MLSILRRTRPVAAPTVTSATGAGSYADAIARHVAAALAREGVEWRRMPGNAWMPTRAPCIGARTITVWVPPDPRAMPAALRPAMAVKLAGHLDVRGGVRVSQDGQYVRVEVPRPDGGVSVPLPHRGTAIARAAAGGWIDLALDDACPHALVAGTTGSGKTTAMLAIAVVESRRARVVAINPKCEPGYGPLALLGHVHATEPPEIRAALAWTRERITERDVERIVVLIDEWTMLDTSMQRDVEAIITTGRAAGLRVVLGTQYPRGDIVSTVTRTNVDAVLVGALEPDASRAVLGDASAASALLGRGDMLLGRRLSASSAARVQVCRVTDADWTSAGMAAPLDLAPTPAPAREPHPSQTPTPTDDDALAWIIGVHAETGAWPGVNRVQRQFGVGAGRATRMLVEARGLHAAGHAGHSDPIDMAAYRGRASVGAGAGMPGMPGMPGMGERS